MNAVEEESLCKNLGELLAAAEVDSVGMLADYFADCGLDTEVAIDVSHAESIEIILLSYSHGIQFTFPVSLAEVWSDLLDIELEYWTPHHLEDLMEAIELVEGFAVTVELDEDLDDPELIQAIGRRITSGGIVVQELWTYDYPFTEPMRDDATVEEWLCERVIPHCRGCRVGYVGAATDTLAALRGPVRGPRRARGWKPT